MKAEVFYGGEKDDLHGAHGLGHLHGDAIGVYAEGLASPSNPMGGMTG